MKDKLLSPIVRVLSATLGRVHNAMMKRAQEMVKQSLSIKYPNVDVRTSVPASEKQNLLFQNFRKLVIHMMDAITEKQMEEEVLRLQSALPTLQKDLYRICESEIASVQRKLKKQLGGQSPAGSTPEGNSIPLFKPSIPAEMLDVYRCFLEHYQRDLQDKLQDRNRLTGAPSQSGSQSLYSGLSYLPLSSMMPTLEEFDELIHQSILSTIDDEFIQYGKIHQVTLSAMRRSPSPRPVISASEESHAPDQVQVRSIDILDDDHHGDAEQCAFGTASRASTASTTSSALADPSAILPANDQMPMERRSLSEISTSVTAGAGGRAKSVSEANIEETRDERRPQSQRASDEDDMQPSQDRKKNDDDNGRASLIASWIPPPPPPMPVIRSLPLDADMPPLPQVPRPSSAVRINPLLVSRKKQSSQKDDEEEDDTETSSDDDEDIDDDDDDDERPRKPSQKKK